MSERIQITYKYLGKDLDTSFQFDAKILAVVDEFPPSDYDGSGTWLASPPYNYRDMEFEWNNGVPQGLWEKLEVLAIPKEVLDWQVEEFETHDDEDDDLDD